MLSFFFALFFTPSLISNVNRYIQVVQDQLNRIRCNLSAHIWDKISFGTKYYLSAQIWEKMCTILKLGVCFLAISFSSGENVEVSLYPKKPHKFERLNCVDQMIITTARLVLSKSVNILKKKNTRCQPKQGRCQETLSIRQGKRHSTPYFTGYSQTCAIFSCPQQLNR